MRKIYKYPLEVTDEQIVNVPANSVLLSAKMADNHIDLFFLCDMENPLKQRVFHIYATNDEIDHQKCLYIATLEHNQYTWHLFEYFA